MKKLSVKKENMNYLEFDNGLFYIVESGYLTFNKDIAENSIDSVDEKTAYREVIPQLELPLTHRCNLNCVYCSFRKRIKERTDLDMPWENIEKSVLAFKKYLENNNINYGRIDFGVTGEPFLREDIFEKVHAYIEGVFKDSNVKKIWAGPYISNATYPVIGEKLNDFCRLQDVSCDGPKEIHDKMRVYQNGEGSFDDLIKSIDKIKSKTPKFGVSAVLTAKNPDFVNIFNYLHNTLKFKSVYMKPVNLKHDVDFSLNENNIEIYKDSYTKLIDHILTQEPNKILDSLLSLCKEDFFMRFFYRIKNRSKQYYRCGCGKSGMYVDTDGKLYPCAHFIGMPEYSIGDLSTGLNTEKIETYSDLDINNREPCKSCWARYLCGGGCLYQSVLANESIKTPDKAKCQLIKHLIVEAIRLYFNLCTEHPDVLNAIPSTIYLSSDAINEEESSTYIPYSKFQPSPQKEMLALISSKTLKETLNKNLNQIFFSLRKTSSKLIFSFESAETSNFDIDFWFCNLDKNEFLKEDLYNLSSYKFSNEFRITKNMATYKADRKETKVERIPYSGPNWITCEEIAVVKTENILEISFDLEKIYSYTPQKLGINFTCRFPEGYTSLITNEPFAILDSDKNGYYHLETIMINEDILIEEIRSKNEIMLPIERWRGMKPNVC